MSCVSYAIYPAVVEKTECGGLSMYFPDIPGTAIVTMDLIDGIGRAKEMLINLILEMEAKGKEIPEPSSPDKIQLLDSSDRIVFIEVYLPPYRDQETNKAVTKNCTLPKWLRDAGENAGLNFSQLLQTALKDSLGIRDDFKRPS